MNNRIFLLLFSAMVILIISGCGVSGCRINFDELKYPASMSGYLYGPTGESIGHGTGLTPIQDFRHIAYLCSIFYSIVPLTRSSDIIELMNKRIESTGGDGMTDVSVSSDYDKLTSVVFLNLLPIWPGCSEVTVKGTIVRLERR
jgi:hypothetical protein